MSSQTKITTFIESTAVPLSSTARSTTTTSSTSSTSATTVVSVREKKRCGTKKLPPASPAPKKTRKTIVNPNPDGFHESHENARSGVHYRYLRTGSYRCIRPELNPPHEPKPACLFTVTNVIAQKAQESMMNHARICWPNLYQKKQIRDAEDQKLNPNKHRKNSAAFADRQRSHIFSLMTSGISPTIPCYVQGCERLLYTTYDLTVHVNSFHNTGNSSVIGFFEKDEWKTEVDLSFPEGTQKHAEFKLALREHIIRSIRTTRYYAYLVVFFPEEVTTADMSWKYLENAEKETRIVPFYAGRATVNWIDFNAEKFHSLETRTQSTILDFIRETRYRAFQLCVLEFNTLDESTDQECIFQLYGWTSKTTKTLLPNTINYNLINVQPEGKNWLKLSENDFSLAVDAGKARTPLICTNSDCASHKVSGKSFGQLNRTEVKLIPFESHV